MSGVVELGYIGLEVSNLAAWEDYASSIVGMESFRDEQTGRLLLRMDLWHHRIAVHEGKSDDLLYVGWRVSDELAFRDMLQQLEAAGIHFERCSNADAEDRRVMDLVRLKDPGGTTTEIFWGPQVDVHKPFHPGRPMYGRFVTGDLGLGHLMLRQGDVAAAIKFYRLLGFRGGPDYKIELGNALVAAPIFMYCNDRQHSVAFGLPMEKAVNHLMVEYTELDDLGIAHDLVKKRQLDISMTLGKHSNDQALSFYVANPSGWLWELGWGGRKPPTHAEYYRYDVFGHANEAKGFGLDVIDASAHLN